MMKHTRRDYVKQNILITRVAASACGRTGELASETYLVFPPLTLTRNFLFGIDLVLLLLY